MVPPFTWYIQFLDAKHEYENYILSDNFYVLLWDFHTVHIQGIFIIHLSINWFLCIISFKTLLPVYCFDSKIVPLQNNAGMLWCCFCICTPKRSFWRKNWIFSGTDVKYVYIVIPCKISPPLNCSHHILILKSILYTNIHSAADDPSKDGQHVYYT